MEEPTNEQLGFLAKLKELKAQQPTNQPCPHCGYCPHCGRGGYITYPLPYYPYYPQWEPYRITWTSQTYSDDGLRITYTGR